MLETYERLRMEEIIVLTTFHQPGLDTYGQRFLDSFAQRVDKRIKLLVYAENCNPVNPDPEQITILDAVKELPKLNAFKERWANIDKANGIPPDDIKARRPRDWHKKFKWDAIRFANKTYAVYDACTRSKDCVCGWTQIHLYIVIGVMINLKSYYQTTNGLHMLVEVRDHKHGQSVDFME